MSMRIWASPSFSHMTLPSLSVKYSTSEFASAGWTAMESGPESNL